MRKAVLTMDASGNVASLDWTENGIRDYCISKRRIAIKTAELIVLGYSIITVAYNAI